MRKTLLTTVAVFGLAAAPAFAPPASAQATAPMGGAASGPATGGGTGGMGSGSMNSGSMGGGAAATDTGSTEPGGSAYHRMGRRHMGSSQPGGSSQAGGLATSATGARPGNEPGTNNSLPTSSQSSNISQADTRSAIAPRLPDPQVGPDASPQQYLQAAQRALSRHRTGEAQQALEMAETRALDRSTSPDAANSPDQNPLVTQIHRARDALARRDMAGADAAISEAMSSASRS